MYRHIGCFIGCLLRRNTHFQKAGLVVLRLIGRILQIHALVGQVPDVLILGIVGLSADLQRNIVSLRIVDLFVPGFDAPFPPGSDDRHIRCKSLDAQLKPDLIVALAGASVTDGVSPLCQGNLRYSLGNKRTGKGRAQHISLIQRSRLHAGKHAFL